jgi:hypothetical protein
MRYWLVVGTACIIVLGGAALCSGSGGEQVQVVPQTNGDSATAEHLPSPLRPPVQAVSQANDNCTHYVDNQVSTDGNGSIDMPWNNIAGHVDDLAPGDVLCVRGDVSGPGRTYAERTISLDGGTGTPSGTEEAPIIVRTYPEERVVLHTTGAEIVDFIEVTHWQFDGFVFDKEADGGHAIRFDWASSNIVRNCEVRNGSGEGIHFSYGEHNVVENCKIHDFDGGPREDAHCILVAGGEGNVIRNNEIYDCTGDGIQFLPRHDVSGNIVESNHFYTTLGPCSENAIDVKIGGPQQTIIRGNVMHGYRPNDGSCGGTGGTVGEAIVIHQEAVNVLVEGNEIYDSGSGIRVINGNGVQIINNIIHDIVTNPDTWSNFGIQVHRGTTVNVLNNTLVDVPRDVMWIGSGVVDLDIRNNIFCRTGRIMRDGTGTAATADYNGWFNAVERIEGPHDVVGYDPLFVSPTDYHLRGISPAVDSGDIARSPTHDFDGNSRPYGPDPDLGAFELHEPRPVTNLRASEGVTTTDSMTVTLIWTAPGRIGQSSTVDHYELRYDDEVITQQSWDQAAVVDASIAAGQAGEVQRVTVNLPWSGSGHLYFALRVFDVDSRASEVSNPAFWPAESTFLPVIGATATSYLNDRMGPYSITGTGVASLPVGVPGAVADIALPG